MGIYLNPGNEGFRTAIRSEIYVDKTGLIGCTNRYLNTEQKYMCVSRQAQAFWEIHGASDACCLLQLRLRLPGTV